MKVPFAPSASAFRTSCPDLIPPSNSTSIRPPTASTMAGSAEMEERAPSCCRPPWFETISASAPLCAASSASSGSRMPFRMSLPPQRSLMRFTSSQLRLGSNCSAVQEDREDRSLTPFACPTMFRKVRRSVPSIDTHQ